MAKGFKKADNLKVNGSKVEETDSADYAAPKDEEPKAETPATSVSESRSAGKGFRPAAFGGGLKERTDEDKGESEVRAEPEKKKKYCTACGAVIADGMKFCEKCGQAVDAEPPTTSEPLNPPEPPIYTEPSTPPTPPIHMKPPTPPAHTKTAAPKIIIISAATVIALCAIIAGVLIFSNMSPSANDIEKLLYAGNTDELSELFEKKYSDSFEKQQEFDSLLYDAVKKKYDEYNNGDISFETLENIYNTAQGIVESKSLQASTVGGLEESIYELQASKAAYQNGNTYLSQKSYYAAIKSFSDVIEEDNNYEDAQTKKADAKTTWKNEVMSETDEKFNNGEYEEAVEILNEFSNHYPDDTDVSAKADEIAAYIPIDLLTITPSKTAEDGLHIGTLGNMDVLGNSYTTALYHKLCYGYEDVPYSEYPLMGKYDTLTFDAFRNTSEVMDWNDSVYGEINIYCDDVLKEAIIVDHEFTVQPYSIDITDTQYLKIEFNCNAGAGTKLNGSWVNMPGSIANVYVAKTK